MHNHKSRLFALLGITMLVGSVLSGAGAVAADYTGAPAVDTSGTDDTASQSELTAGETWNESGGPANQTLQIIADSNDSKVVHRHGPSLREIASNASLTSVTWNSTDGDGHFNATVEMDSFTYAEHKANQNVTINTTLINDTTASSPNKTYEEWFIQYSDNRSVQVVDDNETDDGIATVTEDLGPGDITIGPLWADNTMIESEDRTVNGSDTDLVFRFENSSVADDYSAALSDDAEAGDRIWGMTAKVGDIPAPVYYQEVPDDVDAEDDTYCLYDQNAYAGDDGLNCNAGADDFDDDTDEIEVTSHGNIGFWDIRSTYGNMAALGSTTDGIGLSIGLGLGGSVFSALAVVARPRREQEA